MSIITNPSRGSHEAYAVTQRGVYHMDDSTLAGARWQNITGNLLQLSRNPFGNPALAETLGTYANATNGTPAGYGLPDEYFTSIVADWRYVLAGSPGGGTLPTHPIIYVGGQNGVYRSLDSAGTWTANVNDRVSREGAATRGAGQHVARSEEHTSELQPHS